jgi:hypothetical protein
METRKWVRNVGLATRAMLGAREQDRGCGEREVGRGARKATRPKSSSMKKEWALVAQAAKMRRKSAQSARTAARKANVGNARAQARASITEP